MGLAAVKKTIEAAGGIIDVRSDPAVARGATFTVNWPKAIQD
jgi:signal transduction histidine kinase